MGKNEKKHLKLNKIKDNCGLLFELVKRDVDVKYKGSALGIIWSFITPMIMLLVYTFVFGVIFKAKWGMQISDSKGEFAMIIFSGLIMFTLFTEVINRATTIISANTNYVKKVIFPLEILPIVPLGTAIVHFFISFIILNVGILFFMNKINVTSILIIIVIIPLIMLTLGLAWILASLGVYIRDVSYIVSVFTQVLFYMSPVFYSIETLPEQMQIVMKLNPLTPLIVSGRNVMVFGKMPEWGSLGIMYVISFLIMVVGYKWFYKVKDGFNDIL